MGFYVHLQVSWGGGSSVAVPQIARKHLEKLTCKDKETFNEAHWFFESVISGKSFFGGPKGDFWAWGVIGNYTNVEEFIELTKPFFMELYKCGELLEHDRVIFQCEPEQNESVSIYQLSSDGNVEEFSSGGKWFWGQF